MPTLEEVLRDVEKIGGTGSVMQGVEVKDVPRIPLPVSTMNRMLYGGVPKGRMVEFYGPESSGKTTTALMLSSAYQKQDDRPIFFVDAEGTYDPRWASFIGVDNSPGRFIKWAPENATAEEVFEQILRIASTNEVGLIILDSIPALVPQQEDAKNMTQYQMGGVSAPLTVFARKLQKILLKNTTVLFVGINQVRDNMSQYGSPTTTPGGRAWRHMCSIRIEFKSENVDANGSYLSDAAENPAGVKIIAALKKNKSAPRNRKLAHYVVDFEHGFDALGDLIDTAIVLGIVTQRGAGVSYTDTETGETISALGKKKFKEKLDDRLINRIEQEVLNCGD